MVAMVAMVTLVEEYSSSKTCNTYGSTAPCYQNLGGSNPGEAVFFCR